MPSCLANGGSERVIFSIFIFFLCWPAGILLGKAENKIIPVRVGVVLDSESWVGKMGLSCINMALSDFYASHSSYNTRLLLYPRNSKGNVVGAAAAALDLIKNVEVQAIIGPDTSMEAHFMIDLGNKAQVPIISFSATSPCLSSIPSSYFIRATQSDSVQVKAISSIVEAFGWRQAVFIYIDNEYGKGLEPYLADALQEINVHVRYRTAISRSATDDRIRLELYKLMSMQTRVFIVHMPLDLGYRVFSTAKDIGMISKGYVWIVTDGISNLISQTDSSILDSMDGVLGVKTYVSTTEGLKNFRFRWKRKFQEDNPNFPEPELNVFGLWAYDATVALAMAVEKMGTTNFDFANPNVSTSSFSTDLETFRISQNGPKLSEALSLTKFRGLAGEFSLVNRQLQSSTFRIINLNGDREKTVAFWTPQNGFRADLHNSTNNRYSTSKDDLRAIIWPGDSVTEPKGWEIPTNGKRLKIGIPVKSGTSNFVRIIQDPNTNTTKATGYSIEVFEAVMEALPYAVLYEYILFADANGKSNGTYDDLVQQVYLGKFDGAVGDITIRASRSKYADFTMPYTESGVSVVVLIKDKKSQKAWLFLKPLTLDLWVTSACFFMFIGFVVWVLEHKVNDDFRGPPSHQIGTSVWFSFSTMVYAHREKVNNNLGRFVVVIWVFVVYVLIQSYTASLTSILTVQHLEPTFTTVDELLKNKVNVGYPKGSFVYRLLKNRSFDESNLIVYENLAHCHELFSNGSIVAAFDEILYMKLFVARYCSKYAMFGRPTFKANGFGFVFPKNSSIVRDISRAILSANEEGRIKEIEDKWFKGNGSCPDPSSLISTSLDLNSFWGLFLITGIASISALIIFLFMFLYKHRHVLGHGDSVWRRVWILLRIFDQKDLNSHTFKKSEVPNRSTASDKVYPFSPSSYTGQRDPKVSFSFGQDTPSANNIDRNETARALPRAVMVINQPTVQIAETRGPHDIDHETNRMELEQRS